jgi:hypothetical protein
VVGLAAEISGANGPVAVTLVGPAEGTLVALVAETLAEPDLAVVTSAVVDPRPAISVRVQAAVAHSPAIFPEVGSIARVPDVLNKVTVHR